MKQEKAKYDVESEKTGYILSIYELCNRAKILC